MRTERVIAIESACRLSLDNGRLRVDREATTNFIALVDLAALILDTPQAELTAGLLRALGENDIAVVVSDSRHYPCAMLSPQRAHSHTVKRQRLQANLSEELRDRFWARTVSAKLRNQLRFLSAQSKSSPLARIQRMAESVCSGDPDNYEAQAAKLYWKELFGIPFKRTKKEADDPRNSALNFGYAILRGLFARYVAVAGLSPIFGFGHKNEDNPYCLVDDLIEPYRPCVDALVVTFIPGDGSFDSNKKRTMLKLLDCEALMAGHRYRLHAAAQETVNSYVRALEAQNDERLDFPGGFVLPL